MRADHGSYFITTYMTNKTIQRIEEKKRKEKK